MKIFGEIDGLHFRIGNTDQKDFREVEIWFGDVLLTPIDKIVYLPQFIHSLIIELNEIKSRSINPDNHFMEYGPTTDDCSSRIKLDGEDAIISFELSESIVHLTRMPIVKLINLLQSVILELKH